MPTSIATRHRPVLGGFRHGRPVSETDAHRLERAQMICLRWLRIAYDHGTGPISAAEMHQRRTEICRAHSARAAVATTRAVLAGAGWSDADMKQAGLPAATTQS